ncbi:mitogen-activated protein kinase-binding protein 1 [Herrania umbratica]|uniref:Mitogen-activated protein kinase-binding protein 1 n=1 Tax=Herrania umbratica TaxID=108875 RepID=A0A6J1AT34_9ROSI|nr:mitogen-activated protein kinase-binding protein 1 [Herrania umbratica]
MKTNRKLKKSDPASSKFVLKEIIGLTAKNENGLASSVTASTCVYVAGCVAVVYDMEKGTQSHLMLSHRMPKPLSCVAVSRDGCFVAAGESGHQPSVLVWDCGTLAFISELKGHLYGVECIAFSSDGEHLVSVGGYIYLWDWRSGILVTKLKASSSCSAVTSVTFSSDSKYIVTAGKKHLKFWAVGASPRTRMNKGTISLSIHAKPINLGPQKGSSFVSVTSAIWTEGSVVNCDQVDELFPIYALTDAGVLCLINSELSLRNSVDLKVEKGFALSASSKLIACACSNGLVQLFKVEDLRYVGSLLYTKAKTCHGKIDRFCPKSSEKNLQSTPTLPDAVACQFISEKLVVVYGDHSLHIWDFHEENEATRSFVLNSHSACIWDIKNLCCENTHDPSLMCAAMGCSGGVSFATCSADGTIRLWDLVLQPNLLGDTVDSNSLINEPVGAMNIVSAGSFEIATVDTTFGNQGFRSMAVSSDGKYLAVGDCEGNLHIYDLHNSDYTCIKDSHDAEILSLSFSLSSTKDADSGGDMDNHYLLASGGRDRIIHLYDVKRNFNLIESIDDHSAAVTSVKLACNGCKILSCSADRSLVFRDVSLTDIRCKISRRHHQMASHGTVYDMSVDPVMEVVVTVGQDKKINTFDIVSGKLIRSFKHNKDFGDPIKVTMDPSGSYLVCSFSNKSICVYDFVSGEMIAQAVGHGEVVTGVIFLPDCKHIVSVGGDGCIFVWKLPARLAFRMLQKVKETSVSLSPRTPALPVGFSQAIICGEGDLPCRIDFKDVLPAESSSQLKQRANYHGLDTQETYAFKLSISRLPKWAQDKVTSSDFVQRNLEFTSPQQKEVEPKILSPLISNGGAYASLCHEHQTPFGRGSGGRSSCHSSLCRSSSNVCKSQSSASPEEFASSATEDHWFTVYNVRLDLLNSPEMQNPKHLKMPVSSPKLVQGLAEIPSESDHSLGHRGHFVDDEHDTMDINAFHMKSEDSDLFKEHFGNLSALLKVKKRQSSTRRRYSSQYFLRRDYLVGCKKLLDKSMQDVGVFKQEKEPATNVNLKEDPSFKEQQVLGSINQDLSSMECLRTPSCALSRDEKDKEDSSTIEEAMAQKQCVDGGSEPGEKITACREALRSLDTAAENVFQLFAKLGTEYSMEEFSSGSGAQLRNEAIELLPKITEKINAVAEWVQNNRSSTGSSTSRVEGSAFEPVLGKLAESLSQRVVEILKKNLSTV